MKNEELWMLRMAKFLNALRADHDKRLLHVARSFGSPIPVL